MEPLSEVHRTSTDFDTQPSKETGKGPMEPPMEMTILTCKKIEKRQATAWSHASAVHRTSTNFETQVGKGPMEPPMEITDLT